MHDLVVGNARVFDGLGNDALEGSVGVKDGRIAAVGDDVGAGKETVDAGGLALAPGIVDIHTHFDAQLTWDPWATPSVALGVTTVVMGNCGFTIAPCRERDRDRTLRNLTHVEGMSLEALLAGVDWDFETYPQYLDMLERKGMVPNVASFVGHSSVRTWALGEEASDRAATAAEVAQMKRLVVEAMEAGAIGFATSTLEQHNGEAGIPMPSRLADEHEMLELTGALGEVGRGVFMLTKGMTSTIPWLESIAANNGRPVNIAAMFIDPNDPERVFREIAEIGEARGRGREAVGAGRLLPARHGVPAPPSVSAGGVPRVAARDTGGRIGCVPRRPAPIPDFRTALKAEAGTATVPNRFSYHSFETLTVMETTCDKHAAYVGRRVADMAREQGKDPFDWLLDFALDDGLDALLDCKLFNTDEDRVKDLLRHPHATLGLSDAGAHLSFLCDAGFGLHLLGHWSRERGDIALPRAVQSVTSRVADAYRIKDRGRLVPGACADLLLFDPETVGRGEKVRVRDLPAGATRVHTPAKGVHGVWVNGTRVVDAAGPIEGAGTPGSLLRDFAD